MNHLPSRMAIKIKQKTKNIKNQIKTFNKNINTLKEDENPVMIQIAQPSGPCKEQ